MEKLEAAKNNSLEDLEEEEEEEEEEIEKINLQQASDDIEAARQETSEALDKQIEKYMSEETPPKKKRGRPKKSEKKKQAPFVEPNQEDIDNSEEFNPPI